MKLSTETIEQLKQNDFLINKYNKKINLIDVKIRLEEEVDKLNANSAQIINTEITKEKKKPEDILSIDLDKGEIIFKEDKDAESEQPPN